MTRHNYPDCRELFARMEERKAQLHNTNAPTLTLPPCVEGQTHWKIDGVGIVACESSDSQSTTSFSPTQWANEWAREIDRVHGVRGLQSGDVLVTENGRGRIIKRDDCGDALTNHSWKSAPWYRRLLARLLRLLIKFRDST